MACRCTRGALLISAALLFPALSLVASLLPALRYLWSSMEVSLAARTISSTPTAGLQGTTAGPNGFKVAGRLRDTEWLLQCVKDPPACHAEAARKLASPGEIRNNSMDMKGELVRGNLSCGRLRLALYGSSYGREVAMSLLSAIRGWPAERNDMNVGSYELPSGAVECSAWGVGYFRNETLCVHSKFDGVYAAGKLCQYSFDVGFKVSACGYPKVKRWRVRPGASNSSGATGLDEPLTPLSTQTPEELELVYAFKSYIYTPAADSAAFERFSQDVRPHVVVTDLQEWGCRKLLDACRVTERERRFFDEDLANPTNGTCRECFRAFIAQLDARVHFVPLDDNRPAEEARAAPLPDDGLFHFIHLVELLDGNGVRTGINGNRVLDAIEQLPPERRHRHLVVDKRLVLLQLPPDEKREHGYKGAATDTWARAMLKLLCR